MILTSSQSGLPLAMVFSSDEKERKSLAKSLTGVAMKYHGKINFATVDAEKHSYFLEFFSLNSNQLPAFTIQTADDIFTFDQDVEITADAIDGFIRRSIGSI
jgi:protein disulfide-isomerase A1